MQTKRAVLVTLSVLLFGKALIAQSASASSTTSSTDPQVQELQTQQAIMDAKLAILQDQQKMTTDMLPASDTKPKSGSITVDGDHPIQSLTIAYTAAERLGGGIATRICNSIACKDAAGTPYHKKIVIYDQAEIASVLNYQAFDQQLSVVQAQFNNSVERKLDADVRAAEALGGIPSPAANGNAGLIAPTLIPGLVEGGLKTVIDIIGLFRTDTSIKLTNFTTDDAALIAATAANLQSTGCVVYQPGVEPVNLLKNQSDLVTKLSTLRQGVTQLQLRFATVKNKLQEQSDALSAILQAQSALAALKSEPDPKKKPSPEQLKAAQKVIDDAVAAYNAKVPANQAINETQVVTVKARKDSALKSLDPGTTTLSNISAALDALQAVMFKADDSGVTVLTKLLRAERLYDVMTAKANQPGVGEAYVLVEKMDILGGGVITKENFFIPTRLYYNGGSIATFTLFGSAGEILAGGTLSQRSNNVRAAKEDGKPGEVPSWYPTNP